MSQGAVNLTGVSRTKINYANEQKDIQIRVRLCCGRECFIHCASLD